MSPRHQPPSTQTRGDEASHVEEGTATGHRRRLWLPVTALAAVGLSLAACSGGSHDAGSTTATGAAATSSTTASTASSTSTSTTTPATTTPSTSTTEPASTTTAPASALAQAQQFTACMRSHGVTDFPEPTDTNGQISFSGGPPGMGRTPDFQSAQQTCSESIYHTAPTGGTSSG